MIDGWGGRAVFMGLVDSANYHLTVLSHDEEIIKICQNKSIPIESEIPKFCDIVVCAGWREKISSSDLTEHKVLNIHYSLLPAYRGLHSLVWAMLNDEVTLGYTIHRMNDAYDDGPIVYQYRIANDFKSTSFDYMTLFNEHVKNNIASILFDYLAEKILEIPQNRSDASWVGKRNLNDCKINFSKSLAYQKAFFRALVSPYPLPFFYYKKDMYSVVKVDFHSSSIVTHIGRILNIDENGVWVSCKGGYLVFKEIFSPLNSELIPYNYFKIGAFLDD